MKRHEALIPFSHDHQHALARALRLRNASASEDPNERRRGAIAFLEFVDAELPEHFHDEEAFLDRAVEASGSTTLASERDRLRGEHELLRRRFEQLRGELERADGPDAALLLETGTALTSHVRYEERELFEQLQREFGDRLHDLA